jgi:formate hydrogenlyase subunit 3/multisubunit Na+/H+ antiporter MnhD subunit
MILFVFLLPFIIIFIPRNLKWHYSFALVLLYAIIFSLPSFNILFGSQNIYEYNIFYNLKIIIDKLSAFFIVVTNFTVLTSIIYAKSYLGDDNKVSNAQYSLHYFSFIYLQLSMLMVLVLRDALSFLISWEIMGLTSFLLVIFETDKKEVLRAGIQYLIQMHIGFFLILIGFMILYNKTGQMSFDALSLYFQQNNNIGLFSLFFIGFGIKAGFIPLHTWLPEAHPAAPSHVSGLMSGVMIKMGIYGIFRILTFIHSDILIIGYVILIVSILSGIFGVMMAIVQHDLKKLLAYHSIENIGIIGIGMGIGTIGVATGNNILIIYGYSGALLHILNHSLFKSLLFYSAGSVYKAYHTRQIDILGGVIHKMPQTSILFLIASIAISGLPPFNGFVSEFLIYNGLFQGLVQNDNFNILIILFSIIGLALIGGLAVFCFTKAFGIVFLGQERKKQIENIMDPNKFNLLPQWLIAFFIILIGLASLPFIKIIFQVVGFHFFENKIIKIDNNLLSIVNGISISVMILFVTIISFILLKKRVLRKRNVEVKPTWGCGYTNVTAKQQYTASSYAESINILVNPISVKHNEIENINEKEIFPNHKKFGKHYIDIFTFIIEKIVNLFKILLKKIAILQTGYIQHYVLYAFIYIIIILILTILNIL